MKLRQATKIYAFPLYGPFKKYAFNVSTCNSILSDVSYAFKRTSSNVYHNIMRARNAFKYIRSNNELTLFYKLNES